MAAVGRGDGPAEILFGFLEDRSGFATQVHIQERRHARWRRSDNPKTAAIGGQRESSRRERASNFANAIRSLQSGKRFFFSGNGIKGEETKVISGVFAENTKRGGPTGTLEIIDPWLCQNHSRRSTGKRNAHQPHAVF